MIRPVLVLSKYGGVVGYAEGDLRAALKRQAEAAQRGAATLEGGDFPPLRPVHGVQRADLAYAISEKQRDFFKDRCNKETSWKAYRPTQYRFPE